MGTLRNQASQSRTMPFLQKRTKNIQRGPIETNHETARTIHGRKLTFFKAFGRLACMFASAYWLPMNRRDHLNALLESHQATDNQEIDFLTKMQALTGSTGDCFSRDHFVPGHFTASAFVLSPDGEQLLLIYHGKLARWLQPGGHVEPSDSNILLAAIREVEEETGLRDLSPIGPGLFDVDIHCIPARKQDPEHLHFDARILLQAIDFKFEAGSDALAAKWVPLEEVNTIESDASVMRAVGKLLQGKKQDAGLMDQAKS
jgi:8-oxo-dGTP pyrophosphatase MutT (NUDIX family)